MSCGSVEGSVQRNISFFMERSDVAYIMGMDQAVTGTTPQKTRTDFM